MQLDHEARTDMEEMIPDHMWGALIRYFEYHIPPGGFLTAVLSNNLKLAVGSADNTNVNYLPAYVRWLTWNVPAISWGSRKNVEEWLKNEEAGKRMVEEVPTEPVQVHPASGEEGT